MRQNLFAPGQTVSWGDLDEIMKGAQKECGPGPFTICTVDLTSALQHRKIFKKRFKITMEFFA